MCTCKAEWDTTVYKQKLFTGYAFSMIHFVFPVIASLVIDKWEYLLIGTFANEILEETLVAFTGRWGYSFDPPYDLESRYDSLLRDIVMSAGLGTLVGARLLRETDSVLMWPGPKLEQPGWIIAKRLLVLLIMERSQIIYYDKVFKHQFNADALYLILVLTLLFAYTYYSARDDLPDRVKFRSLLLRSYAIVVFAASLFIYPLLEEHYLVLISFAVSMIFIVVERHRTSEVGPQRASFDFVLVCLMLWLVYWCVGEPYVYDGVQYNRHWCGVASDADGRCAVY